MNLVGIELAVRERLGIDVGSLGAAVLPRAVEIRLKARGLASTEGYLGLLATDPAEAESLCAELVVGETWFFRGGRPLFNRLAEFIAGRGGERFPERPVRILSVPCSTGEEPYSLAITFQEQLIPPEHWQIDAIDISPRHLDRAAAGRYTPFAFREAGEDIRPLYFQRAATPDDRLEILPYLRQRVRFRSGNVTDPTFLVNESPYDLIVCRNLFIYLTPEARKQAMATLDRLLVIDGRLCLTPGEADRLPPGQFVTEGPTEFGIYRRVGVGSALHTIPPAVRQPGPAAEPTPIEIPAQLPAQVPQQVIPPTQEKAPPPITLESAHALANGGRLVEALALCDRLLRGGAVSADAYTLLGAIHQAQGRPADAADAFRRALYLDPDHPEALSHMIVICERRGDAPQASALRRRLARVVQEDAP